MTFDLHMIVLPGGAYDGHADHEAEAVVQWLESEGISASVLRYPVRTRHPEPTVAIHAAVARVRAGGARRIGLLGFSAGAHAAALAGYGSDVGHEAPVDLLVLSYPVVSMIQDAHPLSRQNLLGEQPPGPETEASSRVDSDSPPTFIWHTADDSAVPVSHAYLLASSLATAGVAHELHVFPHGAHGLGLAFDAPHVGQWRALLLRWLTSTQESWALSAR